MCNLSHSAGAGPAARSIHPGLIEAGLQLHLGPFVPFVAFCSNLYSWGISLEQKVTKQTKSSDSTVPPLS